MSPLWGYLRSRKAWVALKVQELLRQGREIEASLTVHPDVARCTSRGPGVTRAVVVVIVLAQADVVLGDAAGVDQQVVVATETLVLMRLNIGSRRFSYHIPGNGRSDHGPVVFGCQSLDVPDAIVAKRVG